MLEAMVIVLFVLGIVALVALDRAKPGRDGSIDFSIPAGRRGGTKDA